MSSDSYWPIAAIDQMILGTPGRRSLGASLSAILPSRLRNLSAIAALRSSTTKTCGVFSRTAWRASSTQRTTCLETTYPASPARFIEWFLCWCITFPERSAASLDGLSKAAEKVCGFMHLVYASTARCCSARRSSSRGQRSKREQQ